MAFMILELSDVHGFPQKSQTHASAGPPERSPDGQQKPPQHVGSLLEADLNPGFDLKPQLEGCDLTRASYPNFKIFR